MLDDLPVHNEALGSDTLFSIQLNYRWRELLAAAMTHYFRRDLSELSLDNQDLLDDFLLDLYDAEAIGVTVLPTILGQELGAVRTTTSLTEVLVTGSNHTFTPTKANFLARYMNICANNSGANQTEIGVRYNALAGSSPQNARTFQSAFTFMQASAIFEGVTIGEAHDLGLYWKVSGGTASMSNVIKLIIEIWEYD